MAGNDRASTTGEPDSSRGSSAERLAPEPEAGRARLVPLALGVLLIVFGIVYSVRLGDTPNSFDERDYYNISSDPLGTHYVSRENDHTPSLRRPVGYPLFLSLFRFTGLGYHLRVLNFFLLAVAALLVFEILRKQHSVFAGWIGAVLTASYPALVYSAGKLYPQVLGGFLIVLVLYLLSRGVKTTARGVALGLVMSALIFTLPVFLALLGVLAVWVLATRMMGLKQVCTVCGITAVLLIGWGFRNKEAYGRFILFGNSGFELLIGNSENSAWNRGADIDITEYTKNTTGLDYFERDDYYKSQAVQYIKDHPGRSLVMYFAKLAHYFHFRNELITDTLQPFGQPASTLSSRVRDIVMLSWYGPVLGLAVAAVFLRKRYAFTRFDALLLILYASSALIYAVFFTRIRYRLPFDFLLILASAGALDAIVARWCPGLRSALLKRLAGPS